MWIVDMLGRLILKSKVQVGTTTFSIDNPGIYIVTVSTNGGTWSQKILVDE